MMIPQKRNLILRSGSRSTKSPFLFVNFADKLATEVRLVRTVVSLSSDGLSPVHVSLRSEIFGQYWLEVAPFQFPHDFQKSSRDR